MFQFTTTTIINGNEAVDVQGNQLLDHAGAGVTKFSAENDTFRVFGTGAFKKEAILSIYKAEAAKGELETAKITVPALEEIYKEGDLLRLEIQVQNKFQGMYVDFQGDFKRPITIDVLAKATTGDTAVELNKLINKLRTDYGFSMVSSTVDGSTLTIKAKENGQRLEAKISLVDVLGETNYKFSPKITELAHEFEVTQSGKPGFGDTAHMLRAVTLPTYENTRHFGTLRDERPIPGALYDQYTIKLRVDSGEDGVWNGDKKSITTHVFWVNSAVTEAFAAAVEGVHAVETVNTKLKEDGTAESLDDVEV